MDRWRVTVEHLGPYGTPPSLASAAMASVAIDTTAVVRPRAEAAVAREAGHLVVTILTVEESHREADDAG